MHSFKKIDPQLTNSNSDKNLLKYFTNFKSFIEVTNKKFVLPECYSEFMEQIENFEVYDSDVFILSYPKTGTTWAQEMVWCIGNNLEFSDTYITLRVPLLEHSSLIGNRENPESSYLPSLEYIRDLPHPRYIKSHLPWDLLPKQIRTGERKPKIICTFRDPKDTAVSMYHYCRTFYGFSGNFNDMMDLFLNGRIIFGPFPAHVLSFNEQRHRENVLVIKYAEMKSDLRSVIKQVIQFLDKNYSDDEISKLEKHLSFESMKNNPAVNDSHRFSHDGGKFLRAGIVGSYKSEMTPELIERFDKWILDNFGEMKTIF
ncbi:luciferin sulfotransferase-like [Chrysoperla carnea]|uniref:luciferin sulfotransferase-like n=1 Tax=Chrysoperla carnea TaxID=189513 RepID=UPI001D06C838|nr:luciferin sulfotransferase-like [Chrysoperla carnea]